MVFRDKVWALSVLNGRDADRFVHDLWEQVGETLPEDARSAPVGLTVRTEGTGNGLLVFVDMPPPTDVTEAHSIVIAAKCGDAVQPTLDELEYVRYFAVERGLDIQTEKPLRILGEWRENGIHANHGVLDAHEERDVVEAIAEVIRREEAN